MSGGYWNYQDELEENYRLADLPKVIDAVIEVLHEIDWAESGDTNRKNAEPWIYDRMMKLGDELFGEHDSEVSEK